MFKASWTSAELAECKGWLIPSRQASAGAKEQSES
eukprot:COSAG02_NODE_27224_length_614_cov_1.236893_1_plen_34_part_10